MGVWAAVPRPQQVRPAATGKFPFQSRAAKLKVSSAAPARPTMKHAHAAEATLPPPPSPLTELQPPVQLVDTRDEKTLLVHDLLLDFDELRGLLGKELYGRRWLDAFLLDAGVHQLLEDHFHRDDADR